jgi:protein subunit release factor B
MSHQPDIDRRLAALKVSDGDLVERFIKGSGPGGQKINKSASCVYLKHVPTGTEVKCQDGRSLDHNRAEARRLLCDALEQRKREAKLQRDRERAKTRAQKRRPSERQKKKTLEQKRRHGEKKRLRKAPPSE